MRQLTLSTSGRLGWEDVPAPVLRGPRSALVRPLAVGRCDFDCVLLGGKVPLPPPIAIGHECVGEVLEVGEEVTAARPGDRVLVAFQVACGTCASCRRGRTANCRRHDWLSCFGLGAAAGGFGGAMSDVLEVPYADAMLVPLPDGVEPAAAAAAACNIPDAYRCVAPQLEAEPGAPVLVVGGDFGTIALYAAAIALALGAERVDYLDADHDRRGRARRLGAHVLEEPSDVGRAGYPITVDASRNPELLAVALRATAPDGVCTASGMYVDPVTPVPLMDMFTTCATLQTGQPHARAMMEPSLALLADGRLPAQTITAAVLDWERAPGAYATAEGKVVFRRSGAAVAG